MSTTQPFQLEVYFSGLVLFIRDADKITHVVLKEGIHAHSNHGFEHTPLLRVKLTPDDNLAGVVNHVLINECLTFEWRSSNDTPVSHGESGATPFGSRKDVKKRLPTKKTRDSFYWVASVADLRLTNLVKPMCHDDSAPKPGIVAQVGLQGGELRTSVFTWVRGKPADKILIPKLAFAFERDRPGPMKRAIAEGITWTVEAPANATKLVIGTRAFGTQDPPTEFASFEVKDGDRARVGVTNYPTKHGQPQDEEADPGPGEDAGSLHFRMLYDLLQPPVSAGIKHIPWVPKRFRTFPLFRNAMPYERLEDSLFLKLNGTIDGSAASLFAKDDRPICAGGSGNK